MKSSSRFLITTSEEQTWKFDCPVIFLGEWCRLYNRKHIWEKMDAVVSDPYGLGLAQKTIDRDKARHMEKVFITKLVPILNIVHRKKHSERFWRIILGPWLRVFIQTGLNRIHTLEKCIAGNYISGSSLIELNKQDLISLNTQDFTYKLGNSAWNSALDSIILGYMQKIDFPITLLNNVTDNSIIKKEKLLEVNSFKTNISQSIKTVLSYCIKDSDSVIVNSYLSSINQVKLQLSLRQVPQFWQELFIEPVASIDLEMRNNLKRGFILEDNDLDLQILSTILFDFLPIVYLEGFAELCNIADNQRYPQHPKFIFTSNSHIFDEAFKVWMAKKSETGTKLLIGQHGSNYGVHRFIGDTAEAEISDTFLAWGNQKPNSKYKNAFVFTTAGKKLKLNASGGLLLVEVCINKRRVTHDCTYEYLAYHKSSKEFVSKLPNSIKQCTTIRLHREYKNMEFYDDLRWTDFDPTLRVDYGQAPIHSLMSTSRLVVFHYDSSGFLENLSLNVPTMMLLENNFETLSDESIPYYQSLVNVGILHLSPESIVNKICEEWDNIDTWWNDKNLQEARISFCIQYAKYENKPIRKLRKILLEG